MASAYKRLLDAKVLTASFLPERDEAFDAGALSVGNVFGEHAAVNETDAYRMHSAKRSSPAAGCEPASCTP